MGILGGALGPGCASAALGGDGGWTRANRSANSCAIEASVCALGAARSGPEAIELFGLVCAGATPGTVLAPGGEGMNGSARSKITSRTWEASSPILDSGNFISPSSKAAKDFKPSPIVKAFAAVVG